MAQLDHLPLRRLEGNLERRKRTGFGPVPTRDAPAHGKAIQQRLEELVETRKNKPKIAGIDPALILKVTTSAFVGEETWDALNLTVLASDEDQSVVLFASDNELNEFRRRVERYQGPVPDGQKNASYASLVGAIEAVSELSPSDRIGPVLRNEGFEHADQFLGRKTEVYDIELWQPSEDEALLFTHRVARRTEELKGTVISEYRGKAATLVRVECNGAAVRGLLDLPEIALIDRPPVPDLPLFEDSQLAGTDIKPGASPRADAITIGIVDSGVTDGHPLLQAAATAAFGVPEELGGSDERGHGTPVSGIALYGDVRECLRSGRFDMRFRFASARVVNNHGRFDDKRLVPQQMEDAIRRLHGEFRCRVINISLGDDSRIVESKPSAWASVLDQLARELDLVIVVSAGNTKPGKLIGKYGDKLPTAYPSFLLDADNRILEPASAVNCLTVGSISHSNGIADDDSDLVGVRPITAPNEPSPFTRAGPGTGKAIKPDLVDYGGTAVLYGENLADGGRRPAAGIVSLNSKYLQRFFMTGSGTSFAAPLVTYKAAVLRDKFSEASANLTRALMALTSDVPEAAQLKLYGLGNDAVLRVCGYGVCDVERALSSDDDRVVMFREDSLAIDRFAVFEVPIPRAFQIEKGERHIKVALAYDPPVRHTRLDYAGVSIGFQLIRGASEQEVFNHFRKWEKAEGVPFRLAAKMKCSLEPGQTVRERGTLQCGTFRAKRDISGYGDQYYLVVRCEGGWETELEEQRFAVAVELRHEAQIQLYEQIQARVRVRV